MNKLVVKVLLGTLFLFSCNSRESDISNKVKVSLRNVGHQLLLTQNDSTSLVLPVKQIQEHKYELSFENGLQIEPDKLASLINQNFKKSELPSSYLVEVENCVNNEIAYSFEMILNEENSIIPCSGRNLPNGCYIISVSFLQDQNESRSLLYLLISLLFSVTVFFIVFYKGKLNSKVLEEPNDTQKLGSFIFYPEQNKLVKQAVEIPLSKKECELVAIFIEKPNQIIKREELTKKVWEDNGVFVGRSLDTYISKIRKKIKEDTSIRLVNIHGVGYKLEVD
ncbi:winged helix-turn-helix domain-containing protein [Tenacibaculum sp. SZ-18]|uniref:winged helix-turn-helix domain-containing protein n=1 Tax=Tenacibaculum sp. SZ-18 TaxID=754423 RepID=UPI000C2D667E|nr:winged helix-turn-helix domain-containing protein [Tenacibaculum sp. SZ-18]